MSDLQVHMDAVNTAVAAIAKQTDQEVTNALMAIAEMLGDIKIMLTEISVTSIKMK